MTETLEVQRQDEASYQLTVDGKVLPFIFKKKDGGKFGSDGSKSRPGNMLPERAHGGPKTVEDLTLESEQVPRRDRELIEWLKDVRGSARAHVVETILDGNGDAWGRGDDWTGVFAEIDTGGGDANSSAPKDFSVMIETDGE
jgi:hypothetical protein